MNRRIPWLMPALVLLFLLPLAAVAAAMAQTPQDYQLARQLFELNQLAEAQQQLERAVAAEPADASAHYQLGMLYRRLGKTALEKRELQAAARLRGQK